MRKPFTPEQDKRITESFADYEVTMKDLAERFGCTPSAISHAIKRHLAILLKANK